MKFIILAFLIWRILLFLPLFFANQALPPYAPGPNYTNLWKFIHPYSPVDNYLLYPWANFDGIHYLTIAGSGYAKDGTNSRFLPLYPLTVAFAANLFGGGRPLSAPYFFSAFFLANSFFLIGLILFYKLIRLDYSEDIARKSSIFLLLFPTSFFFGSLYSESLFLLLTLLAFYFARKKQWFYAGISGLLLTATRIVGISILPAMTYEYITQGKISLKKLPTKQAFLKVIPIVLIPLGVIVFAWFNQMNWQDPLHFLKAHAEINNGRSASDIILFPQTIYRYIKILISVPSAQFTWWIAFLELGMFFFVVMLLYIGYKKGVRKSYLLFALCCFLIPTLSGTFTSLPRYTAILFPIFLSLALLRNRYVQIVYAIASGALLFILLAFFSRGYYVA